jgi:ribonuclease R
MQEHVGEQFHGVVSSVTRFGLFVQLTDLLIDGLVHVTSLPNDYYHFDPATQSLVGERSGQRFRLGDPLEVRVARVDMETRRIDFRPAWEGYDSGRPRSRRRGR